MKKKLLCCCIMAAVFMLSGMANASLTVIGTATYNNSDYNLIWDNDDNLIWLDYSNDLASWDVQVAWASSLNEEGTLTCNIDSTYTVDWGENAWRLPTTIDDDSTSNWDGNSSKGYNNDTTSELAHLFYIELGNLARVDTSGHSRTEYGLENTGDFSNLVEWAYWSGTEYSAFPLMAWRFGMVEGEQGSYMKTLNYYSLAVCNAQVSPVPVPGAIWLLASGLLGIAAKRRKNG